MGAFPGCKRAFSVWYEFPLAADSRSLREVAPAQRLPKDQKRLRKTLLSLLLQRGLNLSYIPFSNRGWVRIHPLPESGDSGHGVCKEVLRITKKIESAGSEAQLANCLAFAETLGGDCKGPELSG